MQPALQHVLELGAVAMDHLGVAAARDHLHSLAVHELGYAYYGYTTTYYGYTTTHYGYTCTHSPYTSSAASSSPPSSSADCALTRLKMACSRWSVRLSSKSLGTSGT